MTQLITQIKMNSKRELFRNPSFLFFSLAMPAGFFLLFTKVFIQAGSPAKQNLFDLSYMNSMIVYSVLISMVFSFSGLLSEDRQQNVQTLLAITPAKQIDYYGSLVVTLTFMNVLSVGIIELLAVTINHVSLPLNQAAGVLGLTLLGGIPMMLLGALIAYAGRSTSIDALCNLVVFPMTIASGLWWPIGMLPHWMQAIGRLMPSYAVKQSLDATTGLTVLDHNLLWLLIGWTVALILALFGLSHFKRDRSFKS